MTKKLKEFDLNDFKKRFPSVNVYYIQENSLDTIEKQLKFGFTREEAEENLEFSKHHYITLKDVYNNCVDKKLLIESLHKFFNHGNKREMIIFKAILKDLECDVE